jgi:alpha-beta hydrolase superfamily lysophospholipase
MVRGIQNNPLRGAVTAVVVASLVAGCATFDDWQRKAIFQHESSERWMQYDAPADAQQFDLTLANGDQIHAWYLPAAQGDSGDSGDTRDTAPTVLFLHGARRNLNGSVARMERMRAVGFNVLAIDYRGFGKSSARLPSEESAIQDTRRAFEELKRREPDASKRFVYGYSLGGALAIELAARENGIAGVIVEASFTSIPDLVRNSKWGWVPGVTTLVTQDFDSIGRIAQVEEPLLFLHGVNDGVVPHQMSDRLAAAATKVPAERKRVLKIDGANHRGVQSVGGKRYDEAVRSFAQLAVQTASAQRGGSLSASTAAATSAAASSAAADVGAR